LVNHQPKLDSPTVYALVSAVLVLDLGKQWSDQSALSPHERGLRLIQAIGDGVQIVVEQARIDVEGHGRRGVPEESLRPSSWSSTSDSLSMVTSWVEVRLDQAPRPPSPGRHGAITAPIVSGRRARTG
jgi:hypothetical protein